MPGYQLVELSSLRPHKREGIAPYENRVGFLDFLRELAQEPLPFPKFHRVRVTGLEDVLFAARPQHEELALRIHGFLKSSAQELEKKLIDVQIVFKGKLMRGDSFWLDYRTARLPIGHIFGTPIRQTDGRGNHYYKKSFSLTNGAA